MAACINNGSFDFRRTSGFTAGTALHIKFAYQAPRVQEGGVKESYSKTQLIRKIRTAGVFPANAYASDALNGKRNSDQRISRPENKTDHVVLASLL